MIDNGEATATSNFNDKSGTVVVKSRHTVVSRDAKKGQSDRQKQNAR